jgi:ATP-dependent DNA ligase
MAMARKHEAAETHAVHVPGQKPRPARRIHEAAVPAETLEQAFPGLDLQLRPPYAPAEARSVRDLPRGAEWLYEPKWDGFRCLAFRRGGEVVLQSKAGQPLTRYFPEIVEALLDVPARKFVLDGEIVVATPHGYDNAGSKGVALDFDALLQRIHPAASRIERLAHETPATYMVFDLLVDDKGQSIAGEPLSARRERLHNFAERFLARQNGRTKLSPATMDFGIAEEWMREGAASGWDGVVAKRVNCEYTSGERTGMVKVKRIRSADCVIGGFRWLRGGAERSSPGKAGNGKAVALTARKPGREVGSLLLGLYNDRGELDHIGFSASFSREERKKLKSILQPLIAGPPRNGGESSTPKRAKSARFGDPDSSTPKRAKSARFGDPDSGPGGFTGKAPGGPSRWTKDDRDTEWVPLKPKLVGEFQYDHFSGGRFRHGTKFLRWRPDKNPRQCTMDQLRPGKLKAA